VFLRSLWTHLGRDLLFRGTQSAYLPASYVSAAYGVFLLGTLQFQSPTTVNPDMCVTVLLLIAASHLLRHLTLPSWYGAFLMGCLLGALYLAKAAQLPLDAVILSWLLFLYGRSKRPTILRLSVVTGLALFTVPWITVLSLHYGRLTFSDSGKMGQLWLVGLQRGMLHPDHVPLIVGSPTHPTRKIFSSPDVFEFSTPIPGTYPAWRDVSYWLDGLSVRLPLGRQIGVFVGNLNFYVKVAIKYYTLLTSVLLVLTGLVVFWRDGTAEVRSTVIRASYLLFWSLAAFLLYACVWVEYRYLAGPLIVFCLSIVGVVLRATEKSPSYNMAAHAVVMVLGVGLLAPQFVAICGRTMVLVREVSGGARVHQHREIANAIRLSGLSPQSRIASVGYSFEHYFARLARVTIVAEVIDSEVPAFWSMPPQQRDVLYRRLRSYDVKAIVAASAPDTCLQTGWIPLAGTPYRLLLLR
jgi:hypothetical protein